MKNQTICFRMHHEKMSETKTGLNKVLKINQNLFCFFKEDLRSYNTLH